MKPKKISDQELVQKSLKDISFFGELVDRYQNKLKFYILRISHFSEMEAEEILQEVFVKVWKNLREFDGSVKFSSWIYRITHNETISAYRKSTTRGEDKQVFLEDDLFNNFASEFNIEQNFDTEMRSEKIRQILDLLPEKYREVLVLKFLEEKSYDEISDILKKPSGTIATLINRAKKAFIENAQRQNITFES